MKRRSSFRKLAGCILTMLSGRGLASGETTKFYWPNRWSEKSLRDHLLKDSKHLFDPAKLSKLTFQDCLDLHDWHHCQIGHKARTPWPEGKHIPGTDPGRGKTTKPGNVEWDKFLSDEPKAAVAPDPGAPDPTGN